MQQSASSSASSESGSHFPRTVLWDPDHCSVMLSLSPDLKVVTHERYTCFSSLFRHPRLFPRPVKHAISLLVHRAAASKVSVRGQHEVTYWEVSMLHDSLVFSTFHLALLDLPDRNKNSLACIHRYRVLIWGVECQGAVPLQGLYPIQVRGFPSWVLDNLFWGISLLLTNHPVCLRLCPCVCLCNCVHADTHV